RCKVRSHSTQAAHRVNLLLRPIERGAEHLLQRPWKTFWRPWLNIRLWQRRWVRPEIQDHVHQLHSRHAVDEAMVNRPHHDRAIALETVEQVRLPQWPAAIQRFAEDRHDRLD